MAGTGANEEETAKSAPEPGETLETPEARGAPVTRHTDTEVGLEAGTAPADAVQARTPGAGYEAERPIDRAAEPRAREETSNDEPPAENERLEAGADAREVQEGAEPAEPAEPVEARVRRRAYELFLERGGAPGDPLTDWVTAEWEIQGGAQDSPPVGGENDEAR